MVDLVVSNLDATLAAAARDPELRAAAAALRAGQLAVAERSLKAVLRAKPTNIAAIRMLAEVAGQLRRYGDAETLLRRALEIAPDFKAARGNYVTVLQRQSKFAEAHVQADQLLAADPTDPTALSIKAAVAARTGDYDTAIAAYESILDRFPAQPKLWVSYGHVLKTVGRTTDSVAAYRRAVGYQTTLGDAWWSLANLKTVRFDAADMAAMTVAIDAAREPADRYHLHFALGKALEDARDWRRSFEHYKEGNRLRRGELPYDPNATSAHVEQTRALMTREALTGRPGGHAARDPIFVVGLPRAGSTLIEQILASHSQVEGTMELPDIGAIAADLSGRHGKRGETDDEAGGYLPHLLALSVDERRALGQVYLDRTRIQRKTAEPRFIDKMPNNFAHIGLIHLILPNAIIIDARRHPMANGFSAFKQHFARGQGFSYDLGELGRYWRDYATLMAHYDAVLPGRVYRVHHEALVADPETQIRALLDHCGLDFEPECLAFHSNPRAVRTASSEQVRRPISGEGLDQWRHYAEWLGPLREALGDAADAPAV